MAHSQAEQPAETKRSERRPRLTVARALLLGALSLGSLVGGSAAASANTASSEPIIGGYTATCDYSTNSGTARPIITATHGFGDTEQQAIADAKQKMQGKPLSVDCSIDDQNQSDVSSAFNNAREQNSDDDDDTTGGSYHQRHNNPGR